MNMWASSQHLDSALPAPARIAVAQSAWLGLGRPWWNSRARGHRREQRLQAEVLGERVRARRQLTG